MDNSRNRTGIVTKKKKNPYEADSCFCKVIRGFDDDVQRIQGSQTRVLPMTRKKACYQKRWILVPSVDQMLWMVMLRKE
jgi:hypothetical protein